MKLGIATCDYKAAFATYADEVIAFAPSREAVESLARELAQHDEHAETVRAVRMVLDMTQPSVDGGAS